MPFNPDTHHRRSIRLRDYDYSQAGAYFVTICAWQRECLFGDIMEGEMRLNDFGLVLWDEWLRTSELRKETELDCAVVMPNHFHGIIAIADDGRGTARRAPTETFQKPVVGSLPTIMRAFKSATTRQINILRKNPGCPVWQRNYFERVIRNEHELARAREYIVNNPLKWELDKENPLNLK